MLLSCKVGKKTVFALKKNKENLRKYSNKGILKCPICEGELIFKAGKIKTWHFAHKSETNCESKNFEPETEEHLTGKKILYSWLKKQPNIPTVELEKWIPEIKLRPDLYFVDENGVAYCVEFQCSPITQEQKDYKTDIYELHEIKPIWISGIERTSAKTKINYDYLLDVKRKEIFKFYTSNNNFYNDIVLIDNNGVLTYNPYVKNSKNFQRMNETENFYFEKGEIVFNYEVNDRWRRYISRLNKLNQEESYNRTRKKYEVNAVQKMKYEHVISEIKDEKKLNLESNLVKKILEGRYTTQDDINIFKKLNVKLIDYILVIKRKKWKSISIVFSDNKRLYPLSYGHSVYLPYGNGTRKFILVNNRGNQCEKEIISDLKTTKIKIHGLIVYGKKENYRGLIELFEFIAKKLSIKLTVEDF